MTVVAFAIASIVPGLATAQGQSHEPLGLADILGRLAAGSTPSYVAHLVKARGISFSPHEYELSLVDVAGGRGALLERIRAAGSRMGTGLMTNAYLPHLAKCAELVQRGPSGQAVLAFQTGLYAVG